MQQQLVFFIIISIKNPGTITKKLLNYCKLLNIDNINFPPTIKDIEQLEKDNPNISITTFQHGGSKKIDDDNDDSNNNNNSNNNNAFTNIEKYDDSESASVNINTNQTNTKKLKREYRIKINDVRISPHAAQRKHLVELLIIRDGENKHFFTISNISRLLSGSKHDRGMHYCKKCYCSFRIIETLNVFIHIIIIFIQR